MVSLERIMSHYFKTIHEQASIEEVAQKLWDVDLGALLVVRNGIPVGMVTEEDILKAVAQGKDLAQTSVIDIIDQGLNTIPLTKPLREVLDEMRGLGVQHLVVQHEGQTVGIVTLRDILVNLGGLFEQKVVKGS